MRRPRLRLVILIVLAAMVVGAIITVAFGSDDSPSPGVIIDWVEREGPPMSPPNARMTSTPVPTVGEAVSGFTYPIEGACLPESETLMPGAPREYRQATHEGVDFYDSDNCTFVGLDTEVLTAKAGTVVRADWAYEDLTWERLAELEDLTNATGGESADAIDAFRGRQVWIEHDDGTVTRYAHLDSIADQVDVGRHVDQGEIVGYVGESGTPESVTDPGTQVHLHFEIRIGESYLGAGKSVERVRALYEAAFSQ